MSILCFQALSLRAGGPHTDLFSYNMCSLQYCAEQSSAMKCSTVYCSAVHFIAVQCKLVQRSAVAVQWQIEVQYRVVQCYSIQYLCLFIHVWGMKDSQCILYTALKNPLFRLHSNTTDYNRLQWNPLCIIYSLTTKGSFDSMCHKCINLAIIDIFVEPLWRMSNVL